MHLPIEVMMFLSKDGANWQSTTYWKALRRFVFGYLNVGNSNYRSKTNAEVTATGCIIYSP